MKLMIDISESIIEHIKDGSFGARPNDRYTLITAVMNGTQLPEGHGRLIDADDAIETLKSLGNRDYRREKGTIQEAEKILSFDEYTPTIIEADKENK